MSAVVVETETSTIEPTPDIGGPMGRRRFALALSAVVVVGLAFRVGYVLMFTRYENGKLYDSFWYGVTANELKQGFFFRLPFGTAPTAAHPPLTSLLVGSVNFVIGLHPGTTVARLDHGGARRPGGPLCGCARSGGGRSVGRPGAAGLAALAPNFWMPSGIVMSETPSMLFMALILLAVVRCLRSPTVLNAVCSGCSVVRRRWCGPN